MTVFVPVVPPRPLGAYEAVIVRGRLGCVSGQFPARDGAVLLPGVAGGTRDLDEARRACWLAADNVLAQVHAATDGFAALEGLLRLEGAVACADDFDAVSAVLDAASERFVEVLGRERGAHARAAVPVARLPADALVELVVSFALAAER